MPGQELDAVEQGLRWLEKVNSGERTRLRGKQVLILGGGDTAMDCARSARCLGAEVTVAYRGPEEGLRALPKEISMAREEGVTFLFEHTPAQLLGEGQTVRTVFETPQGVQSIDSSDVILAFGQQPCLQLCVQCLEGITPGIVADWRANRHAKSEAPVYCSDCHGNDHQQLHLPTPAVCANCHEKQHGEFLDEARYGFPSHVLAMERAVDAPHFADKPKAEVQSCVQCHSVATKCDSCHSRHRFDAAEARRPEACITCHSGPPHPDDETYFASAHGQLYLAEGKDWDWSKPLIKGNYKAPTCAYCHMDEGKHQVAHKSLWKFGLREVNPHTSQNKVLRQRWIKLCSDCHEEKQAAQWLTELDQERKQAWNKLYQAEDVLKDLRRNDLLQPPASERPNYPMGSLWPRERIGFFEGQASAFYNVSGIERDYFEMWYFDNLRAYKSAAHGDPVGVRESHEKMAASLDRIETQADKLHQLSETVKETEVTEGLSKLWNNGAYTDHNREHN